MYYRLVICFLIFLLSIKTEAQSLPKIDEILDYSQNLRHLKTDCFVTYNLEKKSFRCLDANISVSFSGKELISERGTVLTLDTSATGKPARVVFEEAPASEQYLVVDLLLPLYKLKPKNIVVSFACSGTDATYWQIEWCATELNASLCSLVGQNVNFVSASCSSGNRSQFVFPITGTWEANSTIAINISRDYDSPADDSTEDVYVDHVRIDMETAKPVE